MSTSSGETRSKAPFLARLHIALFVLLCVGSSVAATFFFLIFDLNSAWEVLIAVAVPPIVLVLARKRLRGNIDPATTDVDRQWAQYRPPLTVKRLLISAAILAAVVVALAILANGGGSDLKVETSVVGFRTQFSIQNIGSNPVTVRDLLVNDRQDCSTLSVDVPIPDDATRQRLLSQLSPYSPEQQHTIWVYGSYVQELILGRVELIARDQPQTLEVGDTFVWTTPCPSVVRLRVTTDGGTATYTFSN